MASEVKLEGGPIWRSSAYAFDMGCSLTGLGNADLGFTVAMWGGPREAVAAETIRRWRIGAIEPPFWAFRGLWTTLRVRDFTVDTLGELLGFAFLD
jgi:hypothetical protein